MIIIYSNFLILFTLNNLTIYKILIIKLSFNNNKKIHRYLLNHKIKIDIKYFYIIYYKMSSNLITYQNFIDNKTKRLKKQFYYVKDIKFTLDKLNIISKKDQQKKKKAELENALFDFYANIYNHRKNLKSIITIQRYFRKYMKENNIYGPGLNEKSNNECDFFNFMPIEEIPKEYLFSYKDKNDFIYSFDIRSFEKLLKNNSENPYNRQPIPDKIIKLFNKRLEYIKSNNIIIEPYEEDKLTPEQEYKNRVFNIFQTIDMLNTTAGGTNPEWFYNLTLVQLKGYYKVLEDIWNYRAQLSKHQKIDIVKNKKMFPKRVHDVFNIYEEQHIREIILTEIEKLLNTSDNDVHRSTASYYVLIAFVEVCPICAAAMPWLIQY